jgi:hypothetical protein
MRKFLVLIIAFAMLGGGAYLTYLQITTSTVIWGYLLAGGAVLSFFGAAILWEDFIAPLFGKRVS